MHVAKWGNSLAVRLPVEAARELGLQAGDPVRMQVDEGQKLVITRARDEDEAARRERMRARMMSRGRPFPPGYKFDRDQANGRDGEG